MKTCLWIDCSVIFLEVETVVFWKGKSGITTVSDINFQTQILSQGVLSLVDMTYFFSLKEQLAIVLKDDLSISKNNNS